MDMLALAQHCAPAVDPQLMVRLVRRESSNNRYAIGLDGRQALRPQPRTFDEAVATAERLIHLGVKFSVGPAQLHIDNIRRYGLTWRQAFHPCTNLLYSQDIFIGFRRKAIAAGYRGEEADYAGLRGYNSGNIHAQVSNDYAADILGRPRPKRENTPRPTNFPSRSTSTSNESLEIFDQ